MSLRKFHAATIVDKRKETDDSITLTLTVPAELSDTFQYTQGQHLPVRAEIDGKSERRTYSICSSVRDATLRIGVRIQPDGVFSNYLADAVSVGDSLEIMPPYGHFNTGLDPANSKTYVAFVAGSGITPILSILKTTLETEPDSEFVVFYGNRKRATTMFVEELWALKNIYRERLALHFHHESGTVRDRTVRRSPRRRESHRTAWRVPRAPQGRRDFPLRPEPDDRRAHQRVARARLRTRANSLGAVSARAQRRGGPATEAAQRSPERRHRSHGHHGRPAAEFSDGRRGPVGFSTPPRQRESICRTRARAASARPVARCCGPAKSTWH